MRYQWKRFRRLLGGATGFVWLLCCSGVIFIGGEEETEWLMARMALAITADLSTGVSIWLFIVSHRELKKLSDIAVEMRAEQDAQGKKKP